MKVESRICRIMNGIERAHRRVYSGRRRKIQAKLELRLWLRLVAPVDGRVKGKIMSQAMAPLLWAGVRP
jgi:hypothetical protein